MLCLVGRFEDSDLCSQAGNFIVYYMIITCINFSNSSRRIEFGVTLSHKVFGAKIKLF